MSFFARFNRRSAPAGTKKSSSSPFPRFRDIDSESQNPKLTPRMEKKVEREMVPAEEHALDEAPVREQVREQAHDEEEDVQDKGKFSAGKKVTTVRPSKKVTTSAHVETPSSGSAHMKMWTPYFRLAVNPNVNDNFSFYTPCSIGLFNVIFAMETMLSGNEYLMYECPAYFSGVVRLYYSVMFFVQILKAQRAANTLRKSDSTWLRAFERAFPFESLPIAGPLVPFFSALCSSKPNDEKFDYVVPRNRTLGLTIAANGVPTVNGSYYLTPNVPMIASFVQFVVSRTQAQMSGNTLFNDEGDFVPFRIGTAAQFAGIDFAVAPVAVCLQTFENPAIDAPFPENKEMMKKLLPHLKKTKLRRLESLGAPAAGTTYTFRTMSEFTRMEEDFTWFEECIRQATVQTKYFSDTVNFSEISGTAGCETLIDTKIRFNRVVAADFYPAMHNNLTAQFRTTRPETEAEHFMNAAVTIVNSTVDFPNWPWANPLGGRQNGDRTGPYWDNRYFEFIEESQSHVGHRTGTVIQSEFFDASGKA